MKQAPVKQGIYVEKKNVILSGLTIHTCAYTHTRTHTEKMTWNGLYSWMEFKDRKRWETNPFHQDGSPSWVHGSYLPLISCNSWKFLRISRNGPVLGHGSSIQHGEFWTFFCCCMYLIVKVVRATATNQLWVQRGSIFDYWIQRISGFFQLCVIHTSDVHVFFVFIQVHNKNIWIGRGHGQRSQTNNWDFPQSWYESIN